MTDCETSQCHRMSAEYSDKCEQCYDAYLEGWEDGTQDSREITPYTVERAGTAIVSLGLAVYGCANLYDYLK